MTVFQQIVSEIRGIEMNTNSEKCCKLYQMKTCHKHKSFRKALKEDPADILAELGEELLAIGF